MSESFSLLDGLILARNAISENASLKICVWDQKTEHVWWQYY